MTFQSRILTISAVLFAAALPALAMAQQAQPPKPEQLIKWRQSAYQVLGWNAGRIKASVEGQFSAEEVAKASSTIAAIANSGLGSLFAPGTETGKGWHETKAKPEIFTDKKVGDEAANFTHEANELVKVAATGDAAAVKEQFGKLQKTCKACHDDFRNKD